MLDGVPHQLHPVMQLELAERVLHGAAGQHEPGGDLLVGQARGDHPQDFRLPFRQLRHGPLAGGGGRLGQPAELPEHERGEPGGEHRVAARRAPHRVEELRAGRGLQQVADAHEPEYRERPP